MVFELLDHYASVGSGRKIKTRVGFGFGYARNRRFRVGFGFFTCFYVAILSIGIKVINYRP
jgi:hypothetical protein